MENAFNIGVAALLDVDCNAFEIGATAHLKNAFDIGGAAYSENAFNIGAADPSEIN